MILPYVAALRQRGNGSQPASGRAAQNACENVHEIKLVERLGEVAIHA
jgi:hypothetical protein